MKITKDFELSGIVKIVIDKEYVWHLCTTNDPSGREDLMWILNAEDVVDDSIGSLPDTHFKTTEQMGAYVRDLVHGGMHRGWVHWDTINFESIVVKCNCDCDYSKVRLRRIVYPMRAIDKTLKTLEESRNASMKLNTKLRGGSKLNETFKKFDDYFSVGPAEPVNGYSFEAHGGGGGYKMPKSKSKEHKIDWIK